MPAIIDSKDSILVEKVLDVLRTCYDPEIPVDIWELGLIYEIKRIFLIRFTFFFNSK